MPAPSDLFSDPEIAQAYEDVRSDKSETTWLVLKYADAKSDNLQHFKTGTGDIAEMAECLEDDEAAYAYVRVKLGNDEYSERTKFVFVVWIGPFQKLHLFQNPIGMLTSSTGQNTKIMRKAKISFQSGEVKRVIRSYAIEIQTSDKKDLDVEAVMMKVRKAMGANCTTEIARCCKATHRLQMIDSHPNTRVPDFF